ncbi:EAL domain-containing protein [Telmatobacter sp. DSM 110680]|uniref:EAL domain-containing protein n=1 Tax=Telmatobacter sp. DSM 110680 TaxID=3036704 RepID=A0AAU7DMH3_9BACT
MDNPGQTMEAERSLRELAESLQESQRIAGLGSYVLDLKTMVWSSSDVLDEIFGIGPDYVRSVEGWTALIYPEDREPMAAYFEEEVLGQHKLFNREYRIISHNKRARRWVHGLGRIEFGANGDPLIMRGTIQDITERKRAEADLRQSEELLQLFTKHAPAALAMFDRNMRYIAASRRWCENFKLQIDDILGRSHYDIFPDLPARWLTIHRRALGGETIKSEDERYDRSDGSIFFVRFEVRPWLMGTGDIGGIIIFSEDITARKHAESRLQLAASVFTHAAEGIVITDPSGIILDVNDAFTQITGYSREEAVGMSSNLLRSGRQGREFYANMWRDLIESGHWSGEIWNRAKDGRIFPELLTITAVRDNAGVTQQYVALFSDISSEKEREQALQRIARYDLLTGLPNRALLRERLHQAMSQASRRGSILAVVCLDLDNFKAINDRHGHAIGDDLLTTIAHRMKSVLRKDDTLARLGGDEFIAVLLDFDNPDQCFPSVMQLLQAASQPVFVGAQSLQLSASAGIACYPQAEDVDADQLLRQAAQALYQSKISGKNRYLLFDSTLALSTRGHHEDLERIRVALSKNEFVLHYQPKMNMATGAIKGAEALIRWNHPERGLLLPGSFLPIVDGHSVALNIGEWVIESALRQLEIWRDTGLDIPISVNISAQQLQQADFCARLNELLVAHPSVDPTKLEIEVLESSALPDMSQIAQVIHSCGRLGVSFALDDFGTGYASLDFLKRLPVDVLKIDQTFVRDMLDDPEDLTIVEGMLGLASAFRRLAVAEGVETIEQGILLLRLGCQVAQGFGIARPMPAEDLPAWVASWRTHPQWSNAVALHPSDRPLLYAGAEHSAWVGAIEAFLHGKRRVPPSLDPTQCRLGAWMCSQTPSSEVRHATFLEAESLHRNLHACGGEILNLSAVGNPAEAAAALSRLHSLRDNLACEVKKLLAIQ